MYHACYVKDEAISTDRTDAGIPVVVDRLSNARISGYLVCFHTGSRDESQQQFGISHLLEHVMFRGTASRSSLDISRTVESAGGQLNAFTSKEMTAYYGVTLDRTAVVVQELVADICRHPNLLQEDIETEKKIVLQEISMWQNDPESYIHKLFSEVLWSGHALSQNEAGLGEVVMSLGDAELREYFQERYRAPNVSIFACGNVDEEQVLSWATENFDPCQGGRRPERLPPASNGEHFRIFPREGEHSYVAMGFPAYDSRHPHRTALRLLNAIMGGGMSSRLFQKVREERGLVYSIYNSSDQYSDAGNMGTFFSSTDENVAEAMSIVAREYHLLKEEGLNPDELQRAKNLIGGSMAKNMESTSSRLYRITQEWALRGSVRTFEEEMRQLESITEEDVMQVAEELLHSGKLTAVVYGKERETLQDLQGSLEI